MGVVLLVLICRSPIHWYSQKTEFTNDTHMNNITLTPYLFFQGNCREAMEFYKGVFGGELTIQTMGDVPPDAQMQGASKDSVMHSALKGGAVTLLGSDSPQASAKAAKVELSLHSTSEEDLRKIFEQLAEGGRIRIPLEKQFWGDVFGAVTDKYNVDWMVNVTTKN